MWIVKLALNRPYTFIVLALLLFLAAPVVLLRTPVDIFPEINIDKVEQVKGFTCSFVTSAHTDAEGRALLRALGMPFRS